MWSGATWGSARLGHRFCESPGSLAIPAPDRRAMSHRQHRHHTRRTRSSRVERPKAQLYRPGMEIRLQHEPCAGCVWVVISRPRIQPATVEATTANGDIALPNRGLRVIVARAQGDELVQQEFDMRIYHGTSFQQPHDTEPTPAAD